MNIVASVCLLVAVSLSLVLSATADFNSAWSSKEFVSAGATFFGRDQWSLNIGSCGYGFVCPNRWSDELASGYDLAAVSDKSPLYSGSHTGAQCGRCLEIRCSSGSVTDGFGDKYSRQSLCKNSASVKVKITDTCDCNFPANARSNARWCCGNQPHLDVSQWALNKIVDNSDRWGVFKIDYRPVGCGETLSNPAPSIPIVKSPHDGDKPANLNCSTQSRNSPGSSSSDSQQRGLLPEATSAQRAPKKASRHSRKYIARHRAFLAVRGYHNPASDIYWKITAYFGQFDKNMRAVRSQNLKNPLT